MVIYLGNCFLIYDIENKNEKNILTTNSINSKNTINLKNNTNKEQPIAILNIDKINLTKNIYNINSTHNNVEENVTILYDDKYLIVLAAHSGPASIAYFDNLDKLEINDIVNLNYKDNEITYKVIKIEEQPKDGTIEINKTNTKQLILTTCSKKDKNKQLVITTEKGL